MTRLLARTRRFYGANPLHLLALIACFALAGYAASLTLSDPDWPTMLIWFLAAIIGHDLVLFPLYALADRSLSGALRAIRLHPRPGLPRVPALNYLRVPLLGTGLLFLLFFPGIIKQGGDTYRRATSQDQQPFLDRWLLLTAVMFGISAILYAARLGYAHRPHAKAPSGSPSATTREQDQTRADTAVPGA